MTDNTRSVMPKNEVTDLIAQAMATDAASRGHARTNALKLIAPAKVNLCLEVGNACADGFHDVETVLHALALHDVLYLRILPASADQAGLRVDLTCTAGAGIEPLTIDPQENLVVRAVKLFANKLGRTAAEWVQIELIKHIPAMAGLGGGSSDAAAALLGVAQLWGVAPDAPELEAAAVELGSDVPFFLRGGCARMTGRGADFVAALEPMRVPVVLIKPDQGVSTARAYQEFDANPVFVSQEISVGMSAAGRAIAVPLFNNLTQVAETLLPELATIRMWAQSCADVQEVLLCGSGSATFAVCENTDVALRIVAEAKKRGWWARSTSFSSISATVVPMR
ncbi:MAG: 4-(cytidine 5'-diphospho)-2-C-methyl-D-erythritol kinase [Raoultibacter sp.]